MLKYKMYFQSPLQIKKEQKFKIKKDQKYLNKTNINANELTYSKQEFKISNKQIEYKQQLKTHETKANTQSYFFSYKKNFKEKNFDLSQTKKIENQSFNNMQTQKIQKSNMHFENMFKQIKLDQEQNIEEQNRSISMLLQYFYNNLKDQNFYQQKIVELFPLIADLLDKNNELKKEQNICFQQLQNTIEDLQQNNDQSYKIMMEVQNQNQILNQQINQLSQQKSQNLKKHQKTQKLINQEIISSEMTINYYQADQSILSDIYQPSLEFNPAVLELYDSDNNNQSNNQQEQEQEYEQEQKQEQEKQEQEQEKQEQEKQEDDQNQIEQQNVQSQYDQQQQNDNLYEDNTDAGNYSIDIDIVLNNNNQIIQENLQQNKQDQINNQCQTQQQDLIKNLKLDLKFLQIKDQ